MKDPIATHLHVVFLGGRLRSVRNCLHPGLGPDGKSPASVPLQLSLTECRLEIGAKWPKFRLEAPETTNITALSHVELSDRQLKSANIGSHQGLDLGRKDSIATNVLPRPQMHPNSASHPLHPLLTVSKELTHCLTTSPSP